MSTQLRGNGKEVFATANERGLLDRRETLTLTQLVVAAASAAPDSPAVVGSDFTVTFADLRTAARKAATAMCGAPRIDDSALTIALMTAVPRLAVSGPGALADTLAAVRMRAMIVLVDRPVRSI